jgi:hypothetical protein
MGNTRACEPLRVWNRLEPRARQADFSRTLRAEVHDPQWLLARQWQFGEFKGEDTGSPVYAKLALRTARIDAFRNQQGGFQPYSDALPLEARVEREAVPVDPARRAQVGRQWLAILHHHCAGKPGYDAAALRGHYLQKFPIQATAATGTTPAAVLARARQESNPRLRQHEAALAGRAVDGIALRARIPSTGEPPWGDLHADLRPSIPAALQAHARSAVFAFRAWYDSIWTEPHSATDTAWSDPAVEYQFSCRVPRPGGGTLTLTSDEYASGRLDWYSFELGPETLPGGGGGGGASAVTTEVFTVIPTPAEYPGQPNPRFWEFEDAAVDLGNIRADTTDLAKVLLSQFALVYGNNWFVVPCEQPVGSLAEIEGIVVADVFGQRSLVRPISRGASSSWTHWDLFSLSRRGTAAASVGQHLLLPPVVHATVESPPVEAVRLVRDEMANTVWAVEHRIASGLGGGRDGHEAARRVAESIRRQEPATTPLPPPDPDAELRYVLGTSVPENWIPFLPVKRPVDGDDRSIRLQRASMPRFFQSTVRPVRPGTRILRSGLTDDDRQLLPLFINEEEVSRAGIQIETAYQRTRWFDGATTVWYGRRVRSGRGAGSSGLRFDVLHDIK